MIDVFRYGMGAKKCVVDHRDRNFASLGLGDFGDSNLESDLTGHIKTVRDQRSTSTCGGQAFAGAIDIVTSQSKYAADYGAASALFIYYLAVRSWGGEMVDDGIDARSCARVLSKQGCCDESKWPFDQERVLTSPSWEAIFGASGRAGCAYGFIRDYGEARIGGIASALHAGIPVVVGLALENSFFSSDGIKTIEVPTGAIVGRHFVLLVGREAGRFKMLNSWGKNWGNNGLAWVADSYIDSNYCFDPCAIYGFDRARERG